MIKAISFCCRKLAFAVESEFELHELYNIGLHLNPLKNNRRKSPMAFQFHCKLHLQCGRDKLFFHKQDHFMYLQYK